MLPVQTVCRQIRFPDCEEFRAALNELISRLGFEDFWLEREGGTSPYEMSALGATMFYEYSQSEGYCMLGAIVPVARNALPDNMLPCDGSTFDKADYPRLWDVLDDQYKISPTQFQTPNLQGRTVIGAGVAAWDVQYDPGNTGGAYQHQLTVNEMPSHTHVQDAHNHTQNSHNHTQNSHNHTQNSHNHTQNSHNHGTSPHNHNQTQHLHPLGLSAASGSGNTAVRGGSAAVTLQLSGTANLDDATVTVNSETATNQAATATNQAATATNQAATATNNASTAVNQNTGGGQPHNNMQPYHVLTFAMIAR